MLSYIRGVTPYISARSPLLLRGYEGVVPARQLRGRCFLFIALACRRRLPPRGQHATAKKSTSTSTFYSSQNYNKLKNSETTLKTIRYLFMTHLSLIPGSVIGKAERGDLQQSKKRGRTRWGGGGAVTRRKGEKGKREKGKGKGGEGWKGGISAG